MPGAALLDLTAVPQRLHHAKWDEATKCPGGVPCPPRLAHGCDVGRCVLPCSPQVVRDVRALSARWLCRLRGQSVGVLWSLLIRPRELWLSLRRCLFTLGISPRQLCDWPRGLPFQEGQGDAVCVLVCPGLLLARSA